MKQMIFTRPLTRLAAVCVVAGVSGEAQAQAPDVSSPPAPPGAAAPARPPATGSSATEQPSATGQHATGQPSATEQSGATEQPGAAPAAASSTGSIQHLLSNVGVTGGLTAEEAGRRAAATSVQADVEHAKVDSAAQDSRNTFYSLLPRVTATARYTRLSEVPVPSLGSGDGFAVATPDGPGVLPADATLVAVDTSFEFPIPLNNYFLNLGVTVPLSDYVLSTTQAIRGSKALREGAELQERAVRLDAAAQAQLSYYSWVRAKLQTVVAKQSHEQALAQVRRMQAYLSAGRVAQADVLQAQAFAAEAELMVTRAETAEYLTEQQLKLAMHVDADTPLAVGEDVMATFERAEEAKSLDELYREAVEHRLELRSLERSAYSLSQASEVLDSRRYPRFEAFGNVTYANPNQRVFPLEEEWRATWDVGVQLVWTINDLGTADAEARKTEAQRVQMLAQRRALEDALRMEILNAHGALREAVLAVRTAEQGQLAAEAALQARESLHQSGRATSLELIQAETTRLQARLNLIEAHIALRTARVQLDHALGRDVGMESPSAQATLSGR